MNLRIRFKYFQKNKNILMFFLLKYNVMNYLILREDKKRKKKLNKKNYMLKVGKNRKN
jgi:preprotein translocase subunit YajC